MTTTTKMLWCAAGVAACVSAAWLTANGQAKYPDWPFPMKYDSVNAAPKNNKLLYEDSKLRLIEVTIKPGQTEPMNGQPYPAVYFHEEPMPDDSQIIDTKLDPDSPLNGQGAGHGTAPAGEDFPTCDTLAPLAPHEVTNHGTVPIHYYVLEFKRLDGADLAANWKVWYPWMLPPIPVVENVNAANLGPPFSKEFPYPIGFDSVKAAPNNHKALYADANVRLVEVTERPESQENLHGHPYRSVFVNDTATGRAANLPSANAAPVVGAVAGRGQMVSAPLGKPGPYHKGEDGDYRYDPNQIPMGRGHVGKPPLGMIAPTCSSATPQAPHAHINGSEVPGHFYRLEFLRKDWITTYPATNSGS